MPVTRNDQPYVDRGTGAYPGPPESVTVNNDYGNEPTGLVPGPPESVTVVSDEHEQPPTGAYPNPPESVTVTEWPEGADAVSNVSDADEDSTAVADAENKIIEPDDAETKTVAKRSRKAAAKKRGA